MPLVSWGKVSRSGSAFPRRKRRRKGERERERGRVPERPEAREGNRNGCNESLEAMVRERKEGKEGLCCMGPAMPFAGARREGYIQVRYASRGGTMSSCVQC